MDEYYPICNLLQVACYMGRKENGLLLIHYKLLEKVQEFIPHHRIKACCGFVQDYQIRVMGEAVGYLRLGLHSL